MRRLAAALCAALIAPAAAAAEGALPPEKAAGAVRVATFNAALSRRAPGELVQALRLGGDPQIEAVVEIIQLVRPDVILINEIDHDERRIAATLFQAALKTGRNGAPGLDLAHLMAPPSNTGVLAPADLDGDGEIRRPADTQGFGWFEGQYALAILSRLPFDEAATRSFQRLLWADMPGALIPRDHYGAAAGALRLSSKTHVDAPVILPDGRRLHLLASHPTPPVFDGPEDRNGRRNHDEVRFWVDYVDGADWMTDDAGREGGLPRGAGWVVLGDLNADPADGDARREALAALLEIAADPRPASAGGREAGAGGANDRHRGAPALDTADWRDDAPGNLRVDYVLPGPGWEVTAAGVFWPAAADPLRRLVGEGGKVSSDHRLVWVDIR